MSCKYSALIHCFSLSINKYYIVKPGPPQTIKTGPQLSDLEKLWNVHNLKMTL
jgi:hypothetical protein